MWDLPGPGLEPMCPELAGGFLTTAPPGKPMYSYFKLSFDFIPALIIQRGLFYVAGKFKVENSKLSC